MATFERAGRGYSNEGKKGPFIKVMLDDNIKLSGSEHLYLFKNDKKDNDKSPDYYVNIKRD
jgi:hypothetical protein